MRTVGVSENLEPLQMALLAERNPHTPHEWIALTSDGDFQAATHKEILTVDDAIVTGEIASRYSLVLSDRVVAQRGICSKRRHSFVNFTAGDALECECHRYPVISKVIVASRA